MNQKNDQEFFKVKALNYHSKDTPGKIGIFPSKNMDSAADLELAYTPGVAYPCQEIAKNIDNIYKYTARGNTIAIISNGTAVLGLGNIGAAASKPVMEGKAALFKKFANVNCVDLELNTENVDRFVDVVQALEYSWGGINLEDIKAPECFIIEQRLQELMSIPIFHDDQHGTAIVVLAALINAMKLNGKKIEDVKIVISGAGAAAIATIKLLIAEGCNKNNIIACDSKGVIYKGRTEGMNIWKEDIANYDTSYRTIKEAMHGADVFIGVSKQGAIDKEDVANMAQSPIIFALANPYPEIMPDVVHEIRSDAIVATGRSDFFNQVNNLMAFPYIFRGTLDTRATIINAEMKRAAAYAIASLTHQAVVQELKDILGIEDIAFGKNYIIPSTFDPRLLVEVSSAVAEAAIKSGVARKKIDIIEYRKQLSCKVNSVIQ